MSTFLYLDLCTNHVTQGTMDLLSTANKTRNDLAIWLGWPAMTIAPYEYGCFVTVPDFDNVEPDKLNALPVDLAAVLRYAFDGGCYVVRFDSSGDHIIGLKYYDW